MIAVIQTTGGTEYWTSFAQGAKARAQRYGFALKWYAPQSAADYEVQGRLLNDAIQHHVSGIILSPSHQLVLAEGVHRAYAAHIPVVIVDAPIAVQPSEYVTSVGCSDEVIGFMAAQHFEQTGANLRVLTVGASPTLQATVQRQDSLRHALQRFAPQVKIVESRYTLSDWGRARQTTLDALAANPEINAIFSSDEFSSHGVLSAIRLLKKSRPITAIIVQNDIESRAALRDGLVSMTMECDSRTVGQLAMDAMHDKLDGKPVEKLIQTGVLSSVRPGTQTLSARR